MAINIYGIKDSANFTVKRKSTGKIFLYSDYATVSENEWSTEQVYALNKSVRAIRWDHSKTSTLKATFEIFDLKWMSMLTGSDFATGSVDVLTREVLTANASNQVTLASTPTTGSLQIYKLDADLLTHLTEQTLGTPATTANEYSITGGLVTLNATSCPENTKVVAYYLKATAVTAQQMEINANAFPYAVEIYQDTLIRDIDQVDKYVQVYYPNAKAKGTFKVTTSAKDITTLEVEFDILKDSDSDNMATYTIF